MKYIKNIFIIIILTLFIFNIKNIYNIFNGGENNYKIAYLANCHDGDTASFYIDDIYTKVRFIGIDAPEIGTDEGEKSKEFVCEILKNAKSIKLEREPKSKEKDKYGRSLYWVFTDGKLLEEEAVKKGFAIVKYIYDDYLYKNILDEAQEAAKRNKTGIWSDY